MRRFVVVLLLGLLTASPAFAQQSLFAAMQGKVTDESGAGIPGATVMVTHQESGIFRQVVSTDDGSYYITGIVPGPYRVTAELQGFRKFEQKDVQFTIGNAVVMEIKMAVGAVEENVTVTGQSPLVDTSSQSIGANIGTAELNALPILNKNWMFAVSLTPGVQIQSSTASFACESLIVGGGSNRSGNFSVDGGGNNDDYLGSSCGSQVRPALESVQEFQVLTNQYDAEFGRTAGAIVNAITKQGTNVFHGAFFGSWTGDSVTAEDYFVRTNNLQKPETSQTDWGGTIGGPVVKDKAHFFYSLDRLVYAEGRSNTFDARPELNYSNTQHMNLWNHMVRFDHQLSASNNWSVRFLEEKSPTFDRVAGRWTLASRDQEFDDDRTYGGNFNTVFGNTRFNQVRFSSTYERNGFTAKELQQDPPIPQNQLPPTLTMLTFVDGTRNGAQFRIDNAYELNDTFTQFVPGKFGGDNNFKMGIQYIYTSIQLPDQTDMNGRFTFSTDAAFDKNNPRTYPERLQIRVPSQSNIYMPTSVMVLFGQDQWRRGNVTLNLGVRYDLEVTPINNPDNPLFKGDEKYAVDKNNVAPRLGFTWNPKGNGRTVIRGGYGLFYDKITLQTTTPFVSTGTYSSSFTANFPASAADPGPSNGRLPTDPMLVNGPVVNFAAINALYPPGSVGRNTSTVNLDNPDRMVPATKQITAGFERQLATLMALTVDYVKSWNVNQLINFDMNPALRVDTSRTGRLVYTDIYNLAGQLGISPYVNPVITRVNDGSSTFDGVNVSLEKRFSSHWQSRVSYAIGNARGNSEANQTADNNYQILGDPSYYRNFGPLDADRRHNLVISGRVELPHTGGLTMSGVYRYLSGRSMSLYNSGVDADRNGRLFDLIPAGHYCGVGANAFCADFDGRRNGAKGPSYTQTDLRFAYKVRAIKQNTLDLNFELFNIANVANFDNPGTVAYGTDQRLSDFMVLTALRGGNGQPRAAQFSARFGW
jgi:hypothetical protein